MFKSSLPHSYHFSEREKHWQQYWETHKLYSWDRQSPKDHTFSIDTPPPSVSGQLHIGHAFSYTQTDFIARFNRMLGKNVFYPMGFDDNGLPTERLVEKQQKVRAVHMPREAFAMLCQEVITDEEEKFSKLFQSMGLSVDWTLAYQTIHPQSVKCSQHSFLALLRKGEIYRSQEPILWDPVDATALAHADVEEK